MILLDTDHASLLKFTNKERVTRLKARLLLLPSDTEFGVTIVTIEEQLRGWLATIARERLVRRHIAPYRELATLFEFYGDYRIVLFDEQAADRFDQLKAAKLRIGTMDLKIAAIALTHHALLLSANLRDFQQIPGLRVENWLD